MQFSENIYPYIGNDTIRLYQDIAEVKKHLLRMESHLLKRYGAVRMKPRQILGMYLSLRMS